MKVDLTTEHEMKENSMNFSNGHCWSGNKLVSKLPTTGFKAKVTEFNQLEERSLKLRRCNTELLWDKSLEPVIPESREDMIQEIMKLRNENASMKSKIKDKDGRRLNDYSELTKKMERSIKELARNLEIWESKKAITKEALTKYITKSEDQTKKENKLWIKEQMHRLGRYIHTRVGTIFKSVWEDGEEFRKLKWELEEFNQERETIEKQRKNLKAKQRQDTRDNSDGSDDNIPQNDQAYQFKLDMKEEKEILSFKLGMNQKSIQKVQEKLDTLEKEKTIFQVELNRIGEEDYSKLCGKNVTNHYEILAGRYLILSLLGKGGYSEVYKAYDLEKCREVACKIHSFDNKWAESMKASYIKHALRENKTHRDMNHPRIVKQFDTVEIDNNSFWTILELWSGPDLFLYLKQQGNLPEKESKLIIAQILSGLKYLDSREKRIIHYDLKPQNILFHKGEIKISDFGLWKEVEANEEKIELTSQGVGTYWYQPPEWFEVGPDPAMISSKVDIWSLGVIFYELLYGFRPFGDKQSQKKILKDRIIINEAKNLHFPAKPGVSSETKEFIKKWLCYHIEDRLSVEQAYFSII